MDIIYKAFDGKEFEEEKDCLYYEREIIANKYKNDIIGLNKEFEKLAYLMEQRIFSKKVILYL